MVRGAAAEIPCAFTQGHSDRGRKAHVTSLCCRKGNPFPGPRAGSCLTLRNELSEETHMLTKKETLLGSGAHPGREQQGKGTQENCSATWLAVSGFMVVGLVSGLSLANHLAWPVSGLTQGPSWRRVHRSGKRGSSEEESGRLAGHIMGWRLLPPLGPSRILPVRF